MSLFEFLFHFSQLGFYILSFLALHPIDKKNAINMIVFMHNSPGLQTGKFFNKLFSIEIKCLYFDVHWATDRPKPEG